jgi:transcriptional regulator GlxA family with amidase domain
MDNKRLIEFFLYPEATGLDIIGPLDVFTAATEILRQNGSRDKGYHAVFSADKAGAVRLNSGLGLQADIAVGDSTPPDIIVLPGGPNTRRMIENQELIGRIRRRAKRAGQIVSICTGAYILAACGLLNGKRVATHWAEVDNFRTLFPEIQVQPDVLYLRDGKIWTSAGVTAGIDLALAMVEEDHGPSLAMDVARLLVLYLRRPGGQSQFSAPMKLQARAGKQFGELHDWIRLNISRELSVDALADFAAMSPRHFSRSFTSRTGMSPGKYVELMRLNRARELLEATDGSLEEIAEACGFLREERLRRVFLRHLNVTPSQYRIHFRSRQPA